jgi:hypothetical protein
MWREIGTAPGECDVEIAVIDRDGVHAISFACRRSGVGWMISSSRRCIDVRPTHWRMWNAPAAETPSELNAVNAQGARTV